MDIEAKKQELENQRIALEQYLQHPVTVEVLRKCDEEQERLLISFLNDSPNDLAQIVAREQAIGHLRGLRQVKALLTENLEEIKAKLKEII